MRPWAALAVLLFLPSAAALSWDAPDEARSGHPVFAAVEGAEAVRVEARMDGFLLWEGDLAAEGGVHPLTLAAPVDGVLTLTARSDDEEAVHEVVVAAAPRNASASPGLGAYPGLGMTWTLDGFRTGAAVGVAALSTQTDGSGRILLSGWDLDGSGFVARYAGTDGVAPHSIVAPHPDDPSDRGATVVAPTVQSPATVVQPTTTAGTLPACEDLHFDPAPLPDLVAWQAGTAIQVVSEGPVRYMMQRVGVEALGSEPTLVFDTTVDDPRGGLWFTPDTPGPAVMIVERGDDRCAFQFLVLPQGVGEAPLEVDVQSTPSQGVRIDYEAHDGEVPVDASLDVRLIRLPYTDAGRFVWSGRLATVDGDARVHVHYLEPGQYRLLTFPSPRDAQGPTFPAERLGHWMEFSVSAPDDVEEQMAAGFLPRWANGTETEPAAEPAPGRDSPAGPWFVVPAALLVWLRRRA